MVCEDDELIDIRLQRSRSMLVVGTSVHFLALVAPWLSNLSFPLQTSVSLLVLIHGWRFYQRQIARTRPDSVKALRYRNDQWLLLTHSGWQRVWPSGTLLVTPWLMAFSFRTEAKNVRLSRNSLGIRSGNYWVCLWSDTGETASLHALRLRLLLKKHNGAER
ncbi:hypothetical protein GZ77_01475 [Endozoicomonas montiporae]|uniref:Toxin CptA n=3 Tax=Endozoicomonas montiporae TaxID=1027273 RepID=A0A081NA78_9GAMM|nr:hypothetical protein EZMO1_2927 [Endozoicomonas montiporae CL-33]KEQ15351.1 hypothetical protein GZ77_01475 [Endozoicomonas montiporae]